MDMDNNIKKLPPSTMEGGANPEHDQLELKISRLLALQKNIKRSLTAVRYTAMLLALSVIIAFNEEMGQMGWGWICAAAGALDTGPNHLCGLMIFLAAAVLLWKGLKLTCRAALDELLEEDSDDCF